MANFGSSSNTLNDFMSMTSLAPAQDHSQAMTGKCLTNINGDCIKGGTLIGGGSGYQLASLGFPSTVCASAGLFARGNMKYTQMGWDVANNAIPLKMAGPRI